MKPEKVHLNAFSLVGTKIRTSNENKGSEIGNHWHTAFQNPVMQTITNKKSDAPFGVYTNYESDYNGMYDHMVAFDGESAEPNIARVDIPESDYLVFDASGPQPETIVNVWAFIWDYFENSEENRSYIADFEEYKNETDARIYIGIK